MIEVRLVPMASIEPLRTAVAAIAAGATRPSHDRGVTRPGLLQVCTQDPTFRVLAGYEDGEALGYTIIRRDPQASNGMIYDLFVFPAHRRRGVGERLLRAAMQRFRDEGCTWARLNVDLDNTAAFRLYQRLGFRIMRHEMHADLVEARGGE